MYQLQTLQRDTRHGFKISQKMSFNLCQRIFEGAIKKKDNPEKMATQGTQDKEKYNTICIGHHYMQANTNNVNKTCALLQTTGGKDEPKIVTDITTPNSEHKDT